MFDERNYAIFSLTEIDKIDFSQVLETSVETLRISTDGTKSFVKWNQEQPVFIDTLTTLEGPYNYEEVIGILSGPEWTTAPVLIRARDEDGRFIGDDSSTPDVNEAWVEV